MIPTAFSGVGGNTSTPVSGDIFDRISGQGEELPSRQQNLDTNPADQPTSNSPDATRKAYQSRFENYVAQSTSPVIAKRYSSALDSFFSKFPDNPSLSFTNSDIDQFKTIRRQEGAPDNTITSELNALKSFQGWAVRDFGGSVLDPIFSAVISKKIQAKNGTSQLNLDVRNNAERKYAGPVTDTTPSPSDDSLAITSSEQNEDSPNPQKSSDTPNSRQLTPRQLQNIEKAKARYAMSKTTASREAVEAAVPPEERQTEDAIAQYGNINSQIKTLEGRLDLAGRAEEKGFDRGRLSPEQVAGVKEKIASLKTQADAAYKSHILGLSDDEVGSLIGGIREACI